MDRQGGTVTISPVDIAWAMVIVGVAVMVVAFLLMFLKKNRSK